MSYILVVDDEADIREIYEMILLRSFSVQVVLAESGNKAVEVIKERGVPALIFSDFNMPDGDGHFLYQSLRDNKWEVPFVISSTDSEVLKKKFPDIYGFIEKPNIVQPVIKMAGEVVNRPQPSPVEYVPIRLSLLLRWGAAKIDLYMKLSETKFVKVINAGDAFLPADAERFYSKGLQYLYITSAESDAFLHTFIESLSMVSNSAPKSTSEFSVISLESLETVERVAKAVGWKPEVIEAAKFAVGLAIKAVASEPNLLKLLKQKMKDPESKYSAHVSLVSLLSCGVCHNLGWISESTQMKLGLAALLHDLTVDESYYSNIHYWNEAAVVESNKNPDVQKYRNHPSEAAKLVLAMKNMPSDVDQIILQHHERKEGSGFPRGLSASRISPLSCIFIIVEDLIHFLDEANDYDERIELFLVQREQKFNSGNFKKVFDAFKESVEKAKGKVH